MRNPIPFDTLEYMDDLRNAGMDQKEASAITKATAKALSQILEAKELATKSDLKDTELSLRKDIKTVEIDLKEIKIELIKSINDSMWKTIGIISSLQVMTLGLFTFIQHGLK